MKKLEFNLEKALPPNTVTYDPSEDYPVRIVLLSSGLIVVGNLIHEDDQKVCILQPHEMHIVWDSKESEIKQYEFMPFMNQLVFHDPTQLVVYPFYKTSISTITWPTDHVSRSFTQQLGMKQAIRRDPEAALLETSQTSPDTVH